MRAETLSVSRGDVAAWDLPFGPAHDPEELAGRAALTARYLSDERSGAIGALAASSGWIHRHALPPDRSCFSFWAPRIRPETIAALADQVDLRPAERILDGLKDAQLARAARQRYSSVEDILYGLHVAAWGHRECVNSLGDARSLDALGVTEFHDYLTRCMDGLRTLRLTEDVPVGQGLWSGMGMPDEDDSISQAWKGGIEYVRTASTRFTVAVAVQLPRDTVDEVTLAVISEALGTMSPGRILHELRERRGIAYSGGAIYRREHGQPVLMATASTLRRHLGECATRLVSLTESFGGFSEHEWHAAAHRVRVKAGAALDDPFASLSEHRRAAEGRPTLAEMIVRAPSVAEELIARPPRPVGGHARAVIGAVDPELERELEDAW